uniref:Uncharacterized protein n=1 Tax=Anguilla anguilla TaxID=7936 RepID=A0A0E9TX99_ANGAN
MQRVETVLELQFERSAIDPNLKKKNGAHHLPLSMSTNLVGLSNLTFLSLFV